ncbi:uncharacterized protein Z518_09370 [Rhinocladiella mackenziei CBS 650.93]|uniref:Uncharacterized protein n=1 Tax=Rhinocladiella mackenziei CBS 650.93 TaxID=1442369 RepID=A0A0D2I736_9EURO|nr:uncharacterized protein Z518_09370 [Rhinocladiella mackenziei CBS 650.93]KIX01644.1 hypothetical protein Z518_09370 [Rhinocladiella mackenziei CBS 650.93]
MSLPLPYAFTADSRPTLYRSRSHTDPSHQDSDAETSPTQPPRLSHVRSRSYLSPADPKPRNAITLPAATTLEKTAEKLPRLHLPGSSYRHHPHHHHIQFPHSQLNNDMASSKRHRPTQSDANPVLRRFQSKEALSSLPHLVAGLNAEREKRNQVAAQHVVGPSGAVTTDNNESGRDDLRYPATSDPNRPPLQPKSSFDLLLEKGDQARFAKRLHVKKEDIMRRDAEIAAAEEEMRTRITSITSTGIEITRRLDYGYYNLLETVGNLVAMITSFQSLSKQSGQLIANFDKETARLDADTRRRVEGFKTGFEARERKAAALAARGKTASARAESLSARLEKAREDVEKWEKREDQVRKVWDRVFGICWWTTIMMFVLVILVVLGKEWWFHGDPVKAGLRAHSEGSWNRSLRLGGDGGSIAAENQRLLEDNSSLRPNVPEDVRRILLGIADRNRNRKVAFPEVPREIVAGSAEAEGCLADVNPPLKDMEHDDPRMKKLDEL